LFTKWSTAGSSRTKLKRMTARLMHAVAALSLAAGCALLPQEEEAEQVSEIRIPKISQKSEYPVKRSTLETKVSGSGKLMAERETNLFFTESNRHIVDVYVKAGDQVKQGQLLAQLDTGDLESRIRAKEIDLEKAELDLKEAMRKSSADVPVLLRKQQLDYELLKSELAQLRKQRDDSKLVAPFDGTIVSFTAETGDMTQAYEKIGRIADMTSLVAAAKFSSSDLASIAAGMETIVSINTAGDHAAKVRRLPVESEQAGGDDDSLDSYTLFDLAAWPEGVGYGTPLTASVIVERRENVLTIPLAALRTQNNRNYVIVSNPDGSKGEVDVEVGVQTATEAEIIKGLEEGQKVVGK